MTPNHATTRLLTALAAVLMIATTATAQVPALPGVGGVPDPTGIAPLPADYGASAGAADGAAQACAHAHTSTGRATGAAGAAQGLAPVPVPALPVAPSTPDIPVGTSLCADSNDPQGTAMGAAAEAQAQAGQAQGILGQVQSWFQGLLGGLPF